MEFQYRGLKADYEHLTVTEEELDRQLERLRRENPRVTAVTDRPARMGDEVLLDYAGFCGGVQFPGGTAQNQTLTLGSGTFIPGFEEQLIGLKVGDKKVIEVTFPEDYQAKHLAGKPATFDIEVFEVAAPGELKLDDDWAKTLGMDNLDALKDIVKQQIESQNGGQTRQKVKRQLLDQLDEPYKFEAPSKLVTAEFNNIWAQVNRDLTAAGKTFGDEDTTEEDARTEYQRLAERRVRLGLVLAEIGEKAGVQVSDDELQRALFESVRSAPAAQQQQIFDYYKNNPGALANLRAPIFEEKVVDHLLGQAKVVDKTVSKEDLFKEDEEDGDKA